MRRLASSSVSHTREPEIDANLSQIIPQRSRHALTVCRDAYHYATYPLGRNSFDRQGREDARSDADQTADLSIGSVHPFGFLKQFSRRIVRPYTGSYQRLSLGHLNSCVEKTWSGNGSTSGLDDGIVGRVTILGGVCSEMLTIRHVECIPDAYKPIYE